MSVAVKSVRVSLTLNGNMKDGRVVMVKKCNWEDLLKVASNKFRIKAKRIFTSDGLEITPADMVEGEEGSEAVQQVYGDPKKSFVVSDGKDFVGFVMDAAKKKKTAQQQAVGTFEQQR